MRNQRRANNRRAHYDPISDSVTPMSQSELAAEAEAVFDIVFDEDPNALSQSGAYSKIFDHFKRYGISNDYSDAVDMAIYIEENLLRHSRRANRKSTMNNAHRRAFRKRASERMNYGDVYTVHSDGSITVHSVGDMEWVDITVYEEELNNDYMYDWGAIEAELYEGVVSSIGGAEPVEVVPGYFISSMSGVDVDYLADLGPGEYRLCPVSLTYLDGEGDSLYSEYDDGFDYDVVIRY